MPDFEVKVERARARKTAGSNGQNELGWLLRFRPRLWAISGLALGACVFGTPHLLVTYHCMGRCSPAHAYSCDYLGVRGWRAGMNPVQGRCPLIRVL